MIKESYFDRYNWLTVERCLRCTVIEQAEWSVTKKNGKLTTKCERTVVTPIYNDEIAPTNKPE